MPTITEIGALSRPEFVRMFAGIFEHSPWVAEAAFDRGPFGSRAELHQAMVAIVENATLDRQLALIRTHPDLAGRAALAGELTLASTGEQASAGLDRLTQDELDRFHRLNDAYRQRFGFPFVMAVKGAGKQAILAGFEERLDNGVEAERARALQEIARIAAFRLADLVTDGQERP